MPSLTAHPTANPAESQYLDLVRRVWTTGVERQDRTGTGTRALFGETMRFDLSDGTLPILTTKRVFWKPAARELLWFLSGDRNIRRLVEQGVHIWTDWPLAHFNRVSGATLDRDAFEARIIADDDFAAKWGDLGPVYGAQWRHWPRYVPAGDGRYVRDADGIDQITDLVHGLRHNPSSRRHIFTGWNVAELASMALPPCHMTYQYFISGNRLSSILYQRSCDLGLGFAFNIFESSLLLRMLAQQCDLEPGEMVWMGADCHLYLNHEHLVTTQLARDPRPFPHFEILRRPADIFGYAIEDFSVKGYDPHPAIAAPVAV
jgi:thymidylate synthase